MNLSRVSNPPKTGFNLSTGLNLEKLNTILSETNPNWPHDMFLEPDCYTFGFQQKWLLLQPFQSRKYDVIFHIMEQIKISRVPL